MSHWITGLIGVTDSMKKIADECDLRCIIALRQGFSLILIEHEDVERLVGPTESQGDEDEGLFDYMHPAWVELLCRLSKGTAFAYIETRYHGGAGGQGAALFQDGHLAAEPDFQSTFATEMTWPINGALSQLGVRSDGESDEFDGVGLGEHRAHPETL